MQSQSLGDRIKRYEASSKALLIPNMPVIIRVDGRAFHTFTRGSDKPFDQKLINAMVESARAVAGGLQGFKAAYIQSDEATFYLSDCDSHESQPWFGNSLQKIVSISASLMSVNFIRLMGTEELPVFDSRAFNVPQSEVANTFLWRAQDWERNSLQMYARAHFSHKELNKKNRAGIHEMLHGIGKNWATDLSPQKKNGTFLINTSNGIAATYSVPPSYNAISEVVQLSGLWGEL